ncbi:hypothetical protein B0O99DRAFT_372939 [Bisporella sp. PMI_857]|nr:hypothetical protein B0O99DRAFT_372939 [Bisporella sp. PMI_857]
MAGSQTTQENNNYRPSILAVYQGAGVSKKSKNGRKAMLSAKAKRQEKGMDRAEVVVDKQEKSIERSKERARIVQGRAKAWDELNKKMLAQNANEEAQVMLALGENWADKENDADADRGNRR